MFISYTRNSLKRWVFSLRRKIERVSAVLTATGSSFHHRGARTENSLDRAELPPGIGLSSPQELCLLNVFSKCTQSLPVPVYDNVLALTNHSASVPQRQSIERQDDLHYASIHHISRSKNQEVPLWLAGSRGQSDHTDEALYSVVRPKTVPE